MKLEVRQMATAFLYYGNEVLMMKKSNSRLYNQEFWSGLGGHLEPEELNNPKQACLREIYEESGLQESDIDDLTLRYILFRIKEDEIRQQFVYIGRSATKDFTPSQEGELHWVNEDDIHQLRLSRIIRFMVEHHYEHRSQSNIMVGTITMNSQQEPHIHWAELKDPEVF